MKRIDQVHVGTTTADGFVIDPAMIGEHEARLRVLVLWQPTARLFELPDRRWLLTLGEPMTTRDITAPGLSAVAVGDQLTTAPLDEGAADAARVSGWHHGEHFGLSTGELLELDPAAWIDLGMPVRQLTAIETIATPPAAREPQPPAPVDLRRAAAVGERSAKTDALIAELRAAFDRGEPTRQSQRGSHRGSRSPSAGRRRSRRDSLLAKLMMRTPARRGIERRHAKYLEQLTRQFRRGNFDDALRNAIGLGSGAAGVLSLRLPTRRNRLEITRSGQGGGGSMPWGQSVYAHLQAVYKQAAEELEGLGRIDEAAFVLAELMNSNHEAIALYERHEMFAEAATLAENRKLAAPIIARLWWLAGNRARAIEVARRGRVFAAVQARLDAVDSEVAHAFRLHWADFLERSGDPLGAVEVGWADEKIRPLLLGLIERGIAHGGEQAVALHVYRAALRPSQENRAAALALLTEKATAQDGETLRQFASALSNAPLNDPVADRELASHTIRALLATPQRTDKQFTRLHRVIRNRADPVLRADMPQHRSLDTSDIVTLGPQARGLIEVVDAAVLNENLVLVALGEFGCRLMRPDGRVVVHYDVPTHSLVMADHGTSALLITGRDPVLEVHRLDLMTRTVRYYGTIAASLWTTSYDGATWVALGNRGLAFYDLLASAPAVVWRELDQNTPCYALARSAERLAAVIQRNVGPQPIVQACLWEHEGHRRLMNSARLDHPDAARLHVLSDATSIWQFADGSQPHVIDKSGKHNNWIPAGADVEVDAEVVAVRVGDALNLSDGSGKQFAALYSDSAGYGVRSQGTTSTIYDSDGRIIGVDQAGRRLLFSMRVVS